jgi:hypothetical protein
MLKERNAKLVQNLQEIIKKYSRVEKLRSMVMDEFKSRNMKASLAVNILNERMELSTLDIDSNKDLILLFVFTLSIFKALSTLKESGDSDIVVDLDTVNPSEFFTKIEVETFTDYKLSKEEELPEDIVFPNMNQINSDFYLGDITCQYLTQLDAGNEFIYNFKTQRDPIVDTWGNKKINIKTKNVEEIVDGLLSGEQFPTTIVVNLLRDGNDYLSYNPKTRELTVRGTKNLVDGMHRKVASAIAMSKNPELNFRWIFVLTNYSEIKAQKYMVEINKQQKMKQEHIKSMDTSKMGNVVVDAIKDISSSEFASKIKDSDKELEFGGLVKKSTLALTIDDVYKDKLQNKVYVKQIAQHISNMMDYIIGLNVEEFVVHPEETKKNSYINHKNMFAGYVALSAELYGDKDWEDKVENVLKKIDFSVDNNYWKDLGLTDTEMSKSTRGKLYKFFKSQL